MSPRILIGTASWSDPGFIGDWYPKGLPAKERLAWYAKYFRLVEVNSTFYAIPFRQVTERWALNTQEDFVFDVKLHRFFSRHVTTLDSLPRPLRPIAETASSGAVQWSLELETALVKYFLEGIHPLIRTGKLGALLLQLSPSFDPDRHKLSELDSLIFLLREHRLAIELRNKKWVTGKQRSATIKFFAERNLIFVSIDGPNADHLTIMPPINVITNPSLSYLRLHGRNAEGFLHGKTVAERFNYNYSDEELQGVASRAQSLAHSSSETHVIFNNNSSGFAPDSAERLLTILTGSHDVTRPGIQQELLHV